MSIWQLIGLFNVKLRSALVSELVSTAIVLQSGSQVMDSDTAALQMSLGRWQPDFLALSYSTKKIATGPEVCRPSDTCTENLFEAYSRKLQTYELLHWQVESCRHTNLFEQHFRNTLQHWLVGTRGLVHEQSFTILWNSLIYMIPHKRRSSIVQDSIFSSVEALAFVCRLCFSPSLQNRTFDADDPQSCLIMPAAYQQSGRKGKAISN